jgi:hypothetical protein
MERYLQFYDHPADYNQQDVSDSSDAFSTTEQIRYSFWNADRYARKTPLLQENGVSRHIFAEKSNTTQYIK